MRALCGTEIVVSESNTKYLSDVFSTNRVIASAAMRFLFRIQQLATSCALFESLRSHVFWRLAGTGSDRCEYRPLLRFPVP